MMGQTMTALGSALRRLVLALLVAALMATMMAVMAAPAFAAGNHLARGQDNSNPGFVNDSVGDDANDVSSLASNPTNGLLPLQAKGERQGEPQGEGVGEN